MNIVKLQNQLKSIPVETLIQYVQGTNPEVPSYLALAEIKSRKDMEAKYAAQNQKAPESSVAEDLTQMPNQGGLQTLAGNPISSPGATQVAQGAPTMSADQGLAGLPTGDMYNEQNFAGGGIIAFDDGGDVAASDAVPTSADMATTSTAPSYADMSYDALVASGIHPMNAAALKGMLKTPASYRGATAGPATTPSLPYGSDMVGEMMRVSPDAFRYSDYSVGRGTSPEAYAGYAALRKEMGSPGYADGGMVAFGPGGDVASKRYQAALEDSYLSPGSLYAGAKDLLGMPFQYGWTTDPVTGKLVRRKDVEGMTPSLDAYRKAADLRKQGLLAEADTLEKAAASPQVKRDGLAGLNTASAGADPGMTFNRDEIANIYQSTVPPTRTRPVVNPNAPEAVNPDVTKPMPGPAKSGIDSLLEKTDGVAESEMDRYDKMMGVNPERAKLEALTKKYETGAGEQERTAPWMALAKAGFTMAGGKSPFAIQNLSEGAVAGLADYAQAKDRLDKLNEKQIDIRSKLLQVDEARKSAAATYGLNSEAAIKTRNAQKQLKQYEEENANLRNAASNETHIKGAQIAAAKQSDYETYIDYAKQDPDNYKITKDKDGNTKKVFDATKVTQAFKSWSGTSSSATDKELIDKWSEKSFDKKFIAQYPTPADFVMAYRQKMSSGNTGTPTANVANRPPLSSILGK